VDGFDGMGWIRDDGVDMLDMIDMVDMIDMIDIDVSYLYIYLHQQ
jgi:hypothetical protein